ncbi:MAG: phosphoribosylaminoimidazolesuccinocarboxamide synthase, partial [Bacteroidales bacterium]|nr:phosphoribosylaminoimidazolesuccinocarboxamide synthase [Bacteroidales bacterium]
KEFVREWLMDQGFQGQNAQPVPHMPDAFVQQVSERYIELYESITGEIFVKSDAADVIKRIETNIMAFLDSRF